MLGIFIGIFLMIAAIMEIIDAIIGDPGGRALSALLGVITLIAGLICFRRPGESLLAIVIVLGIYLVAAGVFRIVRALGSEGRRWWGVGLGALDAVRRHRDPVLAGARARRRWPSSSPSRCCCAGSSRS